MRGRHWNGPGQDDNKDGIADATNVLRLFDAPAGRHLRRFDELGGPSDGPHVPINTPWTKPPFSKLRKGPRSHPDHARIHRSVQLRVTGMAGYQPTGLVLTEARLFDAARLVD